MSSPVTQPPASVSGQGSASFLSPGFVSDNYYVLAPAGSTYGNGGTNINGQIFLLPFVIYTPVTISALVSRVTSSSSGGLFGLAIYTADPVTKKPTGLPITSVLGLSSSSSTTVAGALASNITLQPGLYWGAAVANDGTTRLITTNGAEGTVYVGTTNLNNVYGQNPAAFIEYRVSGTYGPFPDLTGASLGENILGSSGSPVLGIKVA